MRFPAARLTDMHTCPMCAGVPAPIVFKGEWTVLTCKMPQARLSDQCVCVGPPPPAGGDPIITGAWTVLVGKMPAARMTDFTAKGGTIISGCFTVLIGTMGGGFSPGAPSLFTLFMQMLQRVVDFFDDMVDQAVSLRDQIDAFFEGDFDWAYAESDDGLSKFLYIEGGLEIDWAFGILPVPKLKGDMGLAKGEVRGHFFDSFPYIGGYAKGDILRAQGSGGGGAFAGQAKLKGTGATGAAGVFVGSDENNPWMQVGATGALAQGEGSVDAFVGSDGRRTGAVIGGKARYETAAGGVTGQTNIPIPFTNWTVGSSGSVGGKAGGGGGGAGGYGYHDGDTGRFHIGGGASGELGVGVGLNFGLSIGPRYEGPPPATPNF